MGPLHASIATMLRILIAAFLFLLPASHSRAAGPAVDPTPLEAFRQRLEGLEPFLLTFDDVPASSEVIDADFSRARSAQYFLRVEEPHEVVDLGQWAAQAESLGDLPIVWNPGRGKWEVVRGRFDRCSDALVRYSWYFLRAFESLDAPLRSTDSVVGLGAAALVATEVVARENWAVTPVELEPSSAAMALFMRFDPEFMPGCFQPAASPDARRHALGEILARMCRAANGEPAPGALHRDPGRLLDRAIETAAGNRPFRLTDLMPPHPDSLAALESKVTEVRPPVLRAALLAAWCPRRYGIPMFQEEASRDWERHLQQILEEVRNDLALRTARGEAPTRLAPKGSASSKDWMRADPTSLRSLLALASQIAAAKHHEEGGDAPRDGPNPHLDPGMRRDPHGGAPPRKKLDPRAWLTVLEEHPAAAAVLALAGSRPELEVAAPSTDPGSPGTRPARLVWSDLRRRPSPEGVPAGSGTERVVVDLVDFQPVGEGEPIRGVDEATPLRVQIDQGGAWFEKRITAGEVKPGMRVRGYPGLARERGSTPFPTDPSAEPTWFEVVDVEKEVALISVSIGCESTRGSGARGPAAALVMALDHEILTRFGSDKARWLAAWSVDPSASAWPDIGGVRFSTFTRSYDPHKVVQFGLVSGTPGSPANNVIVEAGEEGAGLELVVDANPLDGGLVEATARLLLANGGSVEASQVVTNPAREPLPGESIVAGFYPRPLSDPWPDNPRLSRHPTRILERNFHEVDRAFEIVLESGPTLVVAPGTEVMTVDEGGHCQSIPVDGARLAAGASVVTNTDEKGNPITAKLARLTEVKGEGRLFVRLDSLNLAHLQVNGMVVSVPVVETDLDVTGLRQSTGIAGTAPGVTSTPSRDGPPVAGRVLDIRALTVPDVPDRASGDLEKKSVALLDMTVERPLEGIVEKVIAEYRTRFVRVRVHDGKKEISLECLPLQPLPVARPKEEGAAEAPAPAPQTPEREASGQLPAVPPTKEPAPPENRFVQAWRLSPGEALLVGQQGEGEVRHMLVTGVTPLFHPHDAAVELMAGGAGFFDRSSTAPVSIGFANGIAFAMPAGCEATVKEGGRRGEGGKGQGEGDVGGGRDATQRGPEKFRAPRWAESPPDQVVDQVKIPPEGKVVLDLRGQEMAALYSEEAGKGFGTLAGKKGEAWVRFWRRVFERAKVDAGLFPLEAPVPSAAIDGWYSELMRRRKLFLEQGAPVAGLVHVLVLEVTLASWFENLGMERTTERLLSDMLELAIYAGCQFHEKDRLQVRLGPHLVLPVLLRVPGWVRGQVQDGSGDVTVSLNQVALGVALDWAERSSFRGELDRGGGKISLSGLLAYWAESAGEDHDPFWEDLPPLESMAAGKGGDGGDGSPAALLESWLADTLRRLREDRVPGADPTALPEVPGATDRALRLGPATSLEDEESPWY